MNANLRVALFSSAFLLSVPATTRAAAGEELPSPVSRVVVYPDRALVSRALGVDCQQTPTLAVFHALPPGIDPTTVRATARGGDARVEGVSLYERVLDEAYAAQVRSLDDQIEQLALKMAGVEEARSRAASSAQQAESLRRSMVPFLTRETAAEKKPQTAVWTQGLDLTREQQDQAMAKQLAAGVELRELGRKLAELQAKRAEVSAGGPMRATEAEVLVRCPASGRTKVELAYMMGGISWRPVYEARADEGAGRVDLSVMAEVVQGTGEPWRDVEVVLSTAVTRRDAKPPESARLNLGASPEEDKKKVLVRHYEEAKHLEVANRLDEAPADQGGEVMDQGLSVQLPVPGKVDFQGDGRPMRLLVETIRLPAMFKLVAVPKLLPRVVRVAETSNGARYPLLPGRLDLFAGGSYSGSAALERTAKGEKMKLAFGLEESIKVKRVVLQEETKDPSFLGSTRRFLYKYRIDLTNSAHKAQTLLVQEHVPVSQVNDVKVLIDEKTTKGYDLQKDDGILTWTVSVAPQEKKQLELHFAVEVPEKYDSNGL